MSAAREPVDPPVATDPAATDPAGTDAAGTDRAGTDRAGTDAATTAGNVIDPRAVRVSVAITSRLAGDPVIVVAPAVVDGPLQSPDDPAAGPATVPPLTPATVPTPTAAGMGDPAVRPLVDGRPVAARLEWLAEQRAVLVRGVGPDAQRTRVFFGPLRALASAGRLVREVVVDGWRFEIELEPERRAALRERAQRGREVAGHSGPLEVRSIIPGRIVALSVAPGDPVETGQQLMVLEAMKMQNELRAPRDGTIERIAVGVGQKVELGDLLLVIG